MIFNQDIFLNMGSWLYKVNNEGQLRWLGPEKGVIGNHALIMPIPLASDPIMPIPLVPDPIRVQSCVWILL